MTRSTSPRGAGVNAQRFADRVGAMSGGRFTIRLHTAGESVPPFFTGVPFGMTALEFTYWPRFGGDQELWQEVYESFGVVAFYVGSSGVQASGWFKRPIDRLDAGTDDLTRRVYDLHRAYVAESGVSAPWSELGLLAMRQGGG